MRATSWPTFFAALSAAVIACTESEYDYLVRRELAEFEVGAEVIESVARFRRYEGGRHVWLALVSEDRLATFEDPIHSEQIEVFLADREHRVVVSCRGLKSYKLGMTGNLEAVPRCDASNDLFDGLPVFRLMLTAGQEYSVRYSIPAVAKDKGSQARLYIFEWQRGGLFHAYSLKENEVVIYSLPVKEPEEDFSSAASLKEGVAEFQESLPMKLGEEVEVVSTTSLGQVLETKVRLFDYSAEGIELDPLEARFKKDVSRVACADMDLRDFLLKKGVVLRYVFLDRDGNHLATVAVSSTDCGSS